jgi:hypothetical protein
MFNALLGVEDEVDCKTEMIFLSTHAHAPELSVENLAEVKLNPELCVHK